MKTIGKKLRTMTAFIITAAMLAGMFPLNAYADEPVRTDGTVADGSSAAVESEYEDVTSSENTQEGDSSEIISEETSNEELSGADEQTEEISEEELGDDEMQTETESETVTEAEKDKDVELTGAANVAAVTIGGNSTNYSNIKDAVTAWLAATGGAELKLLADVTWENDDNDSIVVWGGTEASPMVLDLNNYGLKILTGFFAGIYIENGCHFELKDGSTNKTKHTVKYHDPCFDENKQIEVTGGYIYAPVNEPGILNSYDGYITMNGGTICGCSSYRGGGVANSGTFVMNGGKICGNFTFAKGGGVYNNSNFVMSGGEISGNTAEEGCDAFCNEGTLTFTGNSISVSEGLDDSEARLVTAEEATEYIGSYGYIKVSSEQIETAAAKITSRGKDNKYNTIEDAVAAWNAAGAGAVLTLLSDVKTDTTIEAEKGSSASPMVLNLNNYGILYTGSGSASVVSVASTGYLKVIDGSKKTKRYIELSEGRGISADRKTTEGKTYTVASGGYIAGGNAGGINNSGSLTIAGGTICGNINAGNGGGVYNTGKLSISGGEIKDNGAESGKAVYNDKGTVTFSGSVYAGSETDGTNSRWVANADAANDVNKYGYISVDASAAGDVIIAEVCPEGSEAGMQYKSLSRALNAWVSVGNGATLRLLSDISITETISVVGGTEGSPMVLDMNDHGIIYEGETAGFVLSVVEDSYLKVIDSSTGSRTTRYITLAESRGIKVSTTKPRKDHTQATGAYITGGTDGGINVEGKICLSDVSIFGNGDSACIESEDESLLFDGDTLATSSVYEVDVVPMSPDDVRLGIGRIGYLKVCTEFNGPNMAAVTDYEGVTKEYTYFSDAVKKWKEAGDGAELKLLNDIETATLIEVNAGSEEKPMIFDLNDHGIRYIGEPSDSGLIKVLSEKHLNLTDSSTTKTKRPFEIIMDEDKEVEWTEQIAGGYITDVYLSADGGAIYNLGTITMTGGAIIQNISDENGGGVYNKGTFILDGGAICYNLSNERGGGIYNEGAFIIKSGVIYGNEDNAVFNGATGTIGFSGQVYAGTDLTGKDAQPVTADAARENINDYGYILVKNLGEDMYLTYDAVAPQTYTGSAVKPEVKVYFGDKLLTENKDYTIKYSDNIKVGTAKFTITGKGSYSGKATGTFNILVKSIKDGDVNIVPIEDQKFNGRAYKAAPVITYNNKKLKNGTDFKVEYFRILPVKDEEGNWIEVEDPLLDPYPVDANTYIALVSGINNFYDTKEMRFKITGSNQTPASKLTVGKIADQVYTGEEITPTVSVKNGSRVLTNDVDYTVTYSENTEVGTAKVTITGIEDKGYIGSKTVTFKIVTLPISKATVNGFTKSFDYDGNAKKQNITLKYKLNKSTTYDIECIEESVYAALDDTQKKQYGCVISYSDNVYAGIAVMTLTGVNRYSGTKTMTYSIVGSKIDKAVITGFEKSLPYTGDKIEQNIDIYKDKSKSDKLRGLDADEFNGRNDDQKEGYDYIYSYEKNTDVGTAVMYIKGVNSYSGTVKKTFKITPYPITNDDPDLFTVEIGTEPFAYAKAGAKPVPVVKFKDKILAEGKDYKLSYANNTALNDLSGTKKPTVKITGKGNFKGLDQSAVFAIVPVSMKDAAAGIRVNVNDMTEQSRADKWKAKVTVTDKDGKTLKAGTDYEKVIVYKDSATDEEIPSGTILSAGKTVKVVITGKGAYKDSATGEYRIVAAGHDISKLTATVAAKSYTGEAVKLSNDDIKWKSGKNVKDDVTIVIDETTYKNNIKNGKATVTVYGTGEYGGKKTVTYTIGKRSLIWWWK